MKRLLAWLAGIVGIAALWRVVARRGSKALPAPAPVVPETHAAPDATTEPAEAPADGDDPAAELRRRLAAAREDGAEPGARAEQQPETLDERRARVHAKAREAIEEMADDQDGAAS